MFVKYAVCVCTCTDTHTHTYTYTYTQTRTHMHTYTHIQTYTYTYTYAHTRTHKHTHTHTTLQQQQQQALIIGLIAYFVGVFTWRPMMKHQAKDFRSIHFNYISFILHLFTFSTILEEKKWRWGRAGNFTGPFNLIRAYYSD
jgi:hypothetical protein